MESAQELLLERLRGAIRDDPAVRDSAIREMRMFGGVSVMIDDRMAVAAGREGDLLVRIDPARSPEAMARGARQAVMGGGRPMGPGWVRVPPDHLGDDDLGYWLRLGVEAGRSR